MTGEDNVLTTHRLKIKNVTAAQPLHLHLIGDIHYDSPQCDRPALHRVLDLVRAQHDAGENYRVLLLGDYNDRCSESERTKLMHAKVHESTQATWDRDALRDLKEVLDALWFARGNIVGCIQGNHYWRFLTGPHAGQSSDAVMAEKLGCKWLGFLSYIRLALYYSTTTNTPYDIVACHGGRGGGKLVGTSINQVDDLRRVFPGADLYCAGHNHQSGAVPAAALFPAPVGGNVGAGSALEIREKKQMLVRTGSFLKGYEQDTPSYVVRGLWKPSCLGHAEIVIALHGPQQSGRRRLVVDAKAVV